MKFRGIVERLRATSLQIFMRTPSLHFLDVHRVWVETRCTTSLHAIPASLFLSLIFFQHRIHQLFHLLAQ